MEMLVAARVKALEDGLLRLQEQVVKTITELAEIKEISTKEEAKQEPIPEDFVILAKFYDRYKFISAPGLGSLIAESPDLWKDHHRREGKNVYVRPVYVIEYLMHPPEGKSKHVRMYNQLIRWHKIHPDLQVLWDNWKVWRTENDLKKKQTNQSPDEIKSYFDELFPKLNPNTGDRHVS